MQGPRSPETRGVPGRARSDRPAGSAAGPTPGSGPRGDRRARGRCRFRRPREASGTREREGPIVVCGRARRPRPRPRAPAGRGPIRRGSAERDGSPVRPPGARDVLADLRASRPGARSASSRTRRASGFLRGFCTVVRRMAASSGSTGFRVFTEVDLLGESSSSVADLSVAAVTIRVSVAGVTRWAHCTNESDATERRRMAIDGMRTGTGVDGPRNRRFRRRAGPRPARPRGARAPGPRGCAAGCPDRPPTSSISAAAPAACRSSRPSRDTGSPGSTSRRA